MPSRSAALFHEFRHSAPHTQRYAVWHAPDVLPSALVVYVHPFAEEMNKARRMAAMQSRALADSGLAVLQMDLLGCGDSAGDFGDASWDAWVADVQAACVLARELFGRDWPRAACPPMWLWGLRAGSLLACAASAGMPETINLLFWQPTPVGKAVLQQFLRLKVAAAMGQAEGKSVSEQLRADLSAQRHVEVAGYRLGPRLASGLERAVLEPPVLAGRLLWMETSARDDLSLLPASQGVIARWKAAGLHVQSHVAAGPAFWNTVEIEDAPALLSATTEFMTSGAAR